MLARRGSGIHRPAATQKISVLLADDNLTVREGVRALLQREPDIEVVGVAADFDGLVAGDDQAGAQVVVPDICMPPTAREGTGAAGAFRRPRMLHQAIVDREEKRQTLARLLPGGLAEKLPRYARGIGETKHVVVTVPMADTCGYSRSAEHADPSALPGQLNEHRSAMNNAVLGHWGTIMQFVGGCRDGDVWRTIAPTRSNWQGPARRS